MHIIYFIMRKWHCNTVNEKKFFFFLIRIYWVREISFAKCQFCLDGSHWLPSLISFVTVYPVVQEELPGQTLGASSPLGVTQLWNFELWEISFHFPDPFLWPAVYSRVPSPLLPGILWIFEAVARGLSGDIFVSGKGKAGSAPVQSFLGFWGSPGSLSLLFCWSWEVFPLPHFTFWNIRLLAMRWKRQSFLLKTAIWHASNISDNSILNILHLTGLYFT